VAEVLAPVTDAMPAAPLIDAVVEPAAEVLTPVTGTVARPSRASMREEPAPYSGIVAGPFNVRLAAERLDAPAWIPAAPPAQADPMQPAEAPARQDGAAAERPSLVGTARSLMTSAAGIAHAIEDVHGAYAVAAVSLLATFWVLSGSLFAGSGSAPGGTLQEPSPNSMTSRIPAGGFPWQACLGALPAAGAHPRNSGGTCPCSPLVTPRHRGQGNCGLWRAGTPNHCFLM
jgi:hypothetical protein